MIRTILIDDEPDSIRILERLLETYCPVISIVGKAEGVESGEQVIRALGPDLVFLDIEMIQGNAFDLLNRLQPLSFQVVFVTAFDDYAIRAFKYSAVDYLLKPVDVDDLRSAVDKVACRSKDKIDLLQIRTLLENVGNLHISQQKMAVPTMTGLNFITISEIIRFEARGNYTGIHLDNGECVLATKNIQEYDSLLPDALFFRIHHSHIINLQKIQKYQKGRGGYIIMEDGSSIEVASRRREEFLSRLIK
jgi:two-component system LytT family response regulator